MNRIEELNQSLKDAWSSDQKVKALKIVIQVRFTFLLCMGTVAFRGVTCLIPPPRGRKVFLFVYSENHFFVCYDFWQRLNFQLSCYILISLGDVVWNPR